MIGHLEGCKRTRLERKTGRLKVLPENIAGLVLTVLTVFSLRLLPACGGGGRGRNNRRAVP
jgi:hypothetical protein